MSEEMVPDEQRTVSSDDDAAAVANPLLVADLSDNVALDSLHKQELNYTEDELRRTVEIIASTGKFCVGWDKLKSMLSSKLKQVLSEYNEGNMTIEEQNSSLGETYPDLVQRLDEVLLSFDEGPPFTLQRLCEILLTAQSIYPKLSKLALALEKNLLVSSMLTSCGDPSPNPATTNMLQEETEGPKKSNGERAHAKSSNEEENGVDNTVISVPTTTDRDELMVDVELEEEEEAEGISSMDMEEATTALDDVAAASADADAAPSLPSESDMKSSE